MYKYLWNKNFNAGKAPDRIKRSIVTTPITRGGLGMIDLKELQTSLDLRSYGRLLVSDHPFFAQISSLIKLKGFFNVNFPHVALDDKLKKGIKLTNAQRSKVLLWPTELIEADVNLRSAIHNTELTQVLTNAGKNSLAAFAVRRRDRRIKLSQLTLNEVTDLSRHFTLAGLSTTLQSMIRTPVNAAATIPAHDLYPIAPGKVLQMSKISSKNFRNNLNELEDQVICLYKSGLTLQPGEVMNWTRKCKQLKSTRHRNSVLRIAHGDVYTNDRLFRFGLAESAKCIHCDSETENLEHRLMTCPLASSAWQQLNIKLAELNLTPLSEITLETILGAGEALNHLEHTLVAELALKLAAGNINKLSPEIMVKGCMKIVAIGEKLPLDTRRALLHLN